MVEVNKKAVGGVVASAAVAAAIFAATPSTHCHSTPNFNEFRDGAFVDGGVIAGREWADMRCAQAGAPGSLSDDAGFVADCVCDAEYKGVRHYAPGDSSKVCGASCVDCRCRDLKALHAFRDQSDDDCFCADQRVDAGP